MAKQKNRVISFFNQSQAETCKITQFPPEIISTKGSVSSSVSGAGPSDSLDMQI